MKLWEALEEMVEQRDFIWEENIFQILPNASWEQSESYLSNLTFLLTHCHSYITNLG